MNDLEIKGAILYAERPEVIDVFRQQLKDFDIKTEDLHLPANVEECLKMLSEKDSVLILDWQKGVNDILAILEPLKSLHKIEMVPTMIIANEMSDKILGCGAEYGVSYVHLGEVSHGAIKSSLDKLFQEVKYTSPIKHLMVKVAEARQNKDIGGALEVLKKMLENDIQNPRIVTEIADIYVDMGEWDRALAILDRFRTEQPSDARGLHLLARCLMKKRMFEDAAKIYNQAKLMNPYNMDRLVALGNVLLHLDRVDEAKENFSEAMTIDESNKQAQTGMGTAMLMQGEVNEALDLLRYSSSPKELASVFNNAAILSMRQGRGEMGISLYTSAIGAIGIKQNEVLARIYYNMGIGYYRFKDMHEAKRCFIKACELDPHYENAKYNVDVVQKMGQVHSIRQYAKTGTHDSSSMPVPVPGSTPVPEKSIKPYQIVKPEDDKSDKKSDYQIESDQSKPGAPDKSYSLETIDLEPDIDIFDDNTDPDLLEEQHPKKPVAGLNEEDEKI